MFSKYSKSSWIDLDQPVPPSSGGRSHAYGIVDSTVQWQQDTCPIDWVDIGVEQRSCDHADGDSDDDGDADADSDADADAEGDKW